jgi:hypothetical protein
MRFAEHVRKSRSQMVQSFLLLFSRKKGLLFDMRDPFRRRDGGADPRLIPGHQTPGQVFAVLSLACLTAAVFTSEPLLAWVDSQPDSRAIAVIQTAARSWNSAMTAIGATKPYHALHDLRRAVEPDAQ